MTGIDKYISELLFDHECVILPGFGGFLTNYSGAHIHPIRHSFDPPSRSVVFNANLSTNDGLLIDYLTRQELISYQEASRKVNEYAASCLREIGDGQTVVFANIGSCKMGREKNIIFEPDTSSNYLEDAFGLPSFVSPAIRRETVRQRLEKQLTPRPHAPKEEKKRNLRPVAGWAAGIAIPIAAAVLVYLYSPNIMNGLGESYASFVPTVTFEKSEATKRAIDQSKLAGIENFRAVPEKPAVTEPDPEAVDDATPEIISTPEPVLTKYQIVVGAFSLEKNAMDYVEMLKSKNYNASIVGKSRTGLIRVGINASNNKSEAINMMEEVRMAENSNAWLLRIR